MLVSELMVAISKELARHRVAKKALPMGCLLLGEACACNSIKVKRLFLYSAEKHGYPWVKRLDLTKISLGSGKRVIAPGSVLDKKYLITAPREAEQ